MQQNQITIEDLKAQGKGIRGYLSEQGVAISHSKSLEAAARSHGFKDWNTASALVSKAEEFWNGEYKKIKNKADAREGGHPGLHASKEKLDRGGWHTVSDSVTVLYVNKEQLAYSGWQMVSGSVTIPGRSSAVLIIVPTISPYFEPRAIRLIGCEKSKPSASRRFIVGAVRVGGSPQLATHHLRPRSEEEGLISDVFSRCFDPLLVNWSVFSTVGLARELEIHLFNMNDHEILVSSCIWGNAVTSLDCYV